MEFCKEKDSIEISPGQEMVLHEDVKVKFSSVSREIGRDCFGLKGMQEKARSFRPSIYITAGTTELTR